MIRGASPKVLFVMGHGASGSTILGNTLGSIDGFFHPGELRTLWDEGLNGLQKCGCGLPVDRCSVWTEILARAFGEGLDPDLFGAWHREAVRVRHTLRLLRLRPGERTGWAALDRYVDVASRLYRAVAEVTGASVIVDTSKRAGDAALLRLVPGVDPYFVQLVRDPRAVVYSWQRRGSERLAVATARDWLAFSALDEAIRLRAGRGRSLFLRHEDFVASPRAALERLVRLVGAWPDELPVTGARTVRIEPDHSMSGHWIRFSTGPIELQEDTAWRKWLSPAERRMTTAVTLPLLVRYGYPVRTAP